MMDAPFEATLQTTTLTGAVSEAAGAPVARDVATLTLVFGPCPQRWGERVHPGATPFPLNRVAGVFPGGPLGMPDVSRVHAELFRNPAGVFILRDLGSKNGTFVNGRPVGGDGSPLAEGDVIRLGETLFLFGTTPVPLPADLAIDGLLGTSPSACTLRSTLGRFAAEAGTVLVRGESGTGKELAARAIATIGRPGRPYLACNAAALPPTLVDATLFGHVRGAFTDAREPRPGLFVSANSGTLFLDEIGDLPPETQVRLLRVLEERVVVPVGAVEPRPIDVRVVVATHKDLPREVAAGRFRADLYARLAQLIIQVPPLRDRIEDVPCIAAAALRELGGTSARIPAEAMARLLRHAWPLNVRELRAVIGQMHAERTPDGTLNVGPAIEERLAESTRIVANVHSADDSPPPAPPSPVSAATPARPRDRAEVEALLARHRGNMSRAAAELLMDRGQFYRLVKRFGIDPAACRDVKDSSGPADAE